MRILFFDTETTGKGNFRAAPDAPGQPRLVQLGAATYDETGTEKEAIDLLVKPDGFEIPKEASAIHGITTEEAAAFGIPVKVALILFRAMTEQADVIVAHNADYDAMVIEGERRRGGAANGALKCVCTMRRATDICKIPGPYGNKWPTLTEAHQFFLGEGFEGAHSALVDVRACARIYFAMKQKGQI